MHNRNQQQNICTKMQTKVLIAFFVKTMTLGLININIDIITVTMVSHATITFIKLLNLNVKTKELKHKQNKLVTKSRTVMSLNEYKDMTTKATTNIECGHIL